MATFAKGEIVLFPFPYTGLSSRKLRPCLLISDEIKDDILLCQITSKNIKPDNYTIELKKHKTINGTLQIDSYIRTNMIFTASKEQIVKKFVK
ncbi:MAG: type II toxin-antitoxin system PemK/MazF family toxin [Nanoarchaeota archaeon]|nr:type II toxin-antitoxin system PemK/MazF family toxin [DPANN group archaeon]MBL7117048.1 type II toxin-antitoxin system PemK/MazF family toxin [Nanoarchaeota archaeon]